MVMLGAIAGDLAGATAFATTQTRNGMCVVQAAGVPASDLAVPNADASGIGLKSRGTRSDWAVAPPPNALYRSAYTGQ